VLFRSGLLAVLMLPFAEWLLGRSSRGRLRQLTDFDHPLLRELRERAPGTFAHTMTLVNMVEPATEATGGDRFLARAGTLYHDIGKVVRPELYKENETNGPSPHDGLSPEQSARAIVSHVAEGLKIARKHRLPPDVTAFIAEHHGTTRIDAVYNKAVAKGGPVDPAPYCYPGPKPRSLETAILMIADSVDAASKSLESPTEESISALVDRVLFRKLIEFQFDECGVNQAELRRVKGAFVAYLCGSLLRRRPPGQSES
jgi:cyclic-di-AMP phosphodiesterase PgpH